MSLSEKSLKSALLGWMLLPEYAHWKGLLRGMLDTVREYVDNTERGRLASFPGQQQADDPDYPNTDALPILGRDRRLPKAILESDHEYAARLRHWREAHKAAGTYPGLLNALRAVLVPTPPVIHIVRSGYRPPPEPSSVEYWTITAGGIRLVCRKADGSLPGVVWSSDGSAPVPINFDPPDWNWDSFQWQGADNSDNTRTWVIIEGPCNAPQLAGVDGNFGSDGTLYGDVDALGSNLTIGTTASESYVQLARATCQAFKAPGPHVENIIVTFVPHLFDPVLGDPGDFPDGHWKYHGKSIVDGGIRKRVTARHPDARYFAGTSRMLDTPEA